MSDQSDTFDWIPAMMDESIPSENQRTFAAELQRLGAIVALTKSGQLLRVDFRPITGATNDATIRMLAGSTRLVELHLDGAAITGACVDDLLTLEKLNVLDVQNTPLDDGAIERLATLPNLTMLLIRGAQVAPDYVRALRRRLTKVRIVG